METDVQRIIADPTLSPEAKVILVTAEIEKQVREAANILASMPDIEVLHEHLIDIMGHGLTGSW